MKKLLIIIGILCPTLLLAQNETSYYENGNIKSEWKTDTIKHLKINYFYFETGELKSQGIFDLDGVLKDYFHFSQNGDTIVRSHIPEFNAQPKKDLSKIEWKTTDSGIGYFFETKGNGEKLKTGEIAKVWYIGYFEDGGQFDNSDITGTILNVEIGKGKYLKSFEEGISLFKKGQKGYIKIPSELGYGNKPAGNIPPNSVLIYEIEIK